MNCRDFVTEADYRLMSRHVRNQSPFDHKKAKKENGTTFSLSLYSGEVDDELAQSIWRGNHYLIHFGVNYAGGKMGWGGKSFAMCDYEVFDTWESFKEWFNKQMSYFANYETEEYGQLCMF